MPGVKEGFKALCADKGDFPFNARCKVFMDEEVERKETRRFSLKEPKGRNQPILGVPLARE